jgi:hypothetical protein
MPQQSFRHYRQKKLACHLASRNYSEPWVLQHRCTDSYYVSFPKERVLFFPKASLQFLLEGSMPEEVEGKEGHP